MRLLFLATASPPCLTGIALGSTGRSSWPERSVSSLPVCAASVAKEAFSGRRVSCWLGATKCCHSAIAGEKVLWARHIGRVRIECMEGLQRWRARVPLLLLLLHRACSEVSIARTRQAKLAVRTDRPPRTLLHIHCFQNRPPRAISNSCAQYAVGPSVTCRPSAVRPLSRVS